MQYKDKNGVIHEFTLIKGESAYESAVIGGFTGTEDEFYERLGRSVTHEELSKIENKITESITNISKELVTFIDIQNDEKYYIKKSETGEMLDGKELSIDYDFTQGLTDSIGNRIAVLSDGVTQDAEGVHLNSPTSHIDIGAVFDCNCTILIEFGEVNSGFAGEHGRLISIYEQGQGVGNYATGLIYRSAGYWSMYGYTSNDSTRKGSWSEPFSETNKNAFSNKKVKLTFDDGVCSVYIDGEMIGKANNLVFGDRMNKLAIGANSSAFYNFTIKKFKVYK